MITFPAATIAQLALGDLQPLDREGSVTVAAAVSTAWVDVISFQVPGIYNALLNGLGVEVRDTITPYPYDGSLLFRVLIDQFPIPDLNGFALQRGTIQAPWQTTWWTRGNSTVKFQARRAVMAANSQRVDARLIGYYYPQTVVWDRAKVQEGR